MSHLWQSNANTYSHSQQQAMHVGLLPPHHVPWLAMLEQSSVKGTAKEAAAGDRSIFERRSESTSNSSPRSIWDMVKDVTQEMCNKLWCHPLASLSVPDGNKQYSVIILNWFTHSAYLLTVREKLQTWWTLFLVQPIWLDKGVRWPWHLEGSDLCLKLKQLRVRSDFDIQTIQLAARDPIHLMVCPSSTLLLHLSSWDQTPGSHKGTLRAFNKWINDKWSHDDTNL
jgi:hypothetical protein